jgi:Bacterial PH domain/Short C-terminal domain
MSRYADSLLADGERIVLRARQHWLATIIDGRYPWALLVAGFVLLVLSQAVSDPVRTWIGYAVLVLFVVSILWLIRIYWAWSAEDYLVTNRRVIKVEGIVNKHTADSSLEKINDAVLDQNVFGRMFNYGDLDILTASDTAVDRYRMLEAAPRFKREMLNQKALLEQEYARPMLPSPPLRASAPVTSPAAPAPAVERSVPEERVTPAPPSRPSMTPDDVTRTLASLADLRDRGAITPEEYEQKKGDLLSRL